MSRTTTNITLDFKGLDNIKKALNRKYEVHVGILGEDNIRVDDDGESSVTNAEIGAIHEFGSPTKNIPARSWLRMPLEKNIKRFSKVLQRANLAEALTDDNIESVLEKLGLSAEIAIDDAFQSRGYGQWAANAASTVKAKGSDKPLINLQEFRRSVHSKVVVR